MNEVSSSQVRKVQKYSVYARAMCSVLMVLLVISVGIVLFALFNDAITGRFTFMVGGMKIAADRMGSAAAMAWLLVIISGGLLCSAAIILMMRRIFDNLSRGEIFSAANARQIRRIAFVVLFIGVGKILLFIGNGILAAQGFFESAQVVVISEFGLPGALTPFAVAGIIYLASWIMRVGLGVSDEAAELRRDAELVV
jgi:Protein of unknown function (DUF2975)